MQSEEAKIAKKKEAGLRDDVQKTRCSYCDVVIKGRGRGERTGNLFCYFEFGMFYFQNQDESAMACLPAGQYVQRNTNCIWREGI